MQTQNSRESPPKRIFLIAVITLVCLGIVGIIFAITDFEKERYFPNNSDNVEVASDGYDIADSTELGQGLYASEALTFSGHDDFEYLSVNNATKLYGSSKDKVWVNRTQYFGNGVLEMAKTTNLETGSVMWIESKETVGEKYVFEADFCWGGSDNGILNSTGYDWYFAIKLCNAPGSNRTDFLRFYFLGEQGKTLYGVNTTASRGDYLKYFRVGEWNNIRIECDTQNRMYSMFVNNMLVYSTEWNPPSGMTFGAVEIEHRSLSFDSVLYFDNIYVSATDND
ncbi:MAG: hypothetical protein IJ488_01600 [Clostridia bacterium]|nr:hypothetical protein [Clostridia bacterium]